MSFPAFPHRLNQNKIQESIQILEDIIKIQPTFKNAYTNLFTILDKKFTLGRVLDADAFNRYLNGGG